MIIQGLTVGELARETVLTLEGLGGKVLSTIKGNSQLVIQNAEWV
jgi:hypothetical protein